MVVLVVFAIIVAVQCAFDDNTPLFWFCLIVGGGACFAIRNHRMEGRSFKKELPDEVIGGYEDLIRDKLSPDETEIQNPDAGSASSQDSDKGDAL